MAKEQFASALIDACPDGVVLVAGDGTILLANPMAAQIFGRDADELVGSCVEDLVPEEYRAGHAAHRADYLEHPTMRPMGTGLRLFGQDADGGMFPVEISLSPVVIDGDVQTIATIRDVTERQESSAHMAMLQDRERIARDIHDMVIQRLFAAGMSLQAIHGEAESPVVAERIRTTIDELDDTIRELRQAIFRIGQDGATRSLTTQITALVHDRSRHLGFEPTLKVSGDIDSLPDFIAEQVIATVTEGLSNVVRHARATTAAVVLERSEGRLVLEITDDGRGLPDGPKQSGGLSNMMWRAAELGGSCTVGPNEPTGTSLRWNVPV